MKWALAGYGPPVLKSMQNVDDRIVEGFGDEWSRFDQSAVSDTEQRDGFDSYFRSSCPCQWPRSGVVPTDT